jgi:hypothetical protein
MLSSGRPFSLARIGRITPKSARTTECPPTCRAGLRTASPAIVRSGVHRQKADRLKTCATVWRPDPAIELTPVYCTPILAWGDRPRSRHDPWQSGSVNHLCGGDSSAEPVTIPGRGPRLKWAAAQVLYPLIAAGESPRRDARFCALWRTCGLKGLRARAPAASVAQAARVHQFTFAAAFCWRS